VQTSRDVGAELVDRYLLGHFFLNPYSLVTHRSDCHHHPSTIAFVAVLGMTLCTLVVPTFSDAHEIIPRNVHVRAPQVLVNGAAPQ
jgi:hypothetical protein